MRRLSRVFSNSSRASIFSSVSAWLSRSESGIASKDSWYSSLKLEISCAASFRAEAMSALEMASSAFSMAAYAPDGSVANRRAEAGLRSWGLSELDAFQPEG
jgi:hypothetical protein